MANVIINGIQAEIDNGLSKIDNGLSNIVGYNFLKTVFSNHQTIQKKRAEEFLKFIKENEQKFTVELINNECFVSGLALTLREIIQQYSEIKRVKIYSIFLGFVESEDKENFELEKMYHTLNLMSLEDLETLKNINSDNSVFVSSNEYNKYTSLNSLGIFDSPPFLGGNSYKLNNFGKKFKKFSFSESR